MIWWSMLINTKKNLSVGGQYTMFASVICTHANITVVLTKPREVDSVLDMVENKNAFCAPMKGALIKYFSGKIKFVRGMVHHTSRNAADTKIFSALRQRKLFDCFSLAHISVLDFYTVGDFYLLLFCSLSILRVPG